MTTEFRIRLAVLISAIVLVAGLILAGLQDSWTRIAQLERRLTTNQFESFRLAETFQSRLDQLNNSMLHYETAHDAVSWGLFEKASTNLDQWIDDYELRLNKEPGVASVRERQLLREINQGYDLYMRAAQAVHTNQQAALTLADALNQLREFDAEAQRLLALSFDLADARRENERGFLEEANRSLNELKRALSVRVLLLLFLFAGLSWAIYRDMVAPLRVKLLESEALLARQEKLATLGTLAAGIAHEIRNPLTSIKARLYTLSKHIRGNEAGLADSAVIGGEISRLERIVQDVLRFARPSDPQLQVIPAHQPLREIHSLMAQSLQASSVQLRLEDGPDLFINVDPELLKQVLLNLVRNSADAIEGAGMIILRLCARRVSLHGKHQDVAVLEVEDSGKGIPPEIEKRLFDPFFTTKDSGTGLGLSIAAGIVEKHGGALQYQTRVGRGTTFGIVLPIASRPDGPPAGSDGANGAKAAKAAKAIEACLV